jgi:hypothetical protein
VANHRRVSSKGKDQAKSLRLFEDSGSEKKEDEYYDDEDVEQDEEDVKEDDYGDDGNDGDDSNALDRDGDHSQGCIEEADSDWNPDSDDEDTDALLAAHAAVDADDTAGEDAIESMLEECIENVSSNHLQRYSFPWSRPSVIIIQSIKARLEKCIEDTSQLGRLAQTVDKGISFHHHSSAEALHSFADKATPSALAASKSSKFVPRACQVRWRRVFNWMKPLCTPPDTVALRHLIAWLTVGHLLGRLHSKGASMVSAMPGQGWIAAFCQH